MKAGVKMAKQSDGKVKYMHNRNRYVCYECFMTFQVFGVLKGNRNRTPFCPNCGENHSVEREKSSRIRKKGDCEAEKIRIPWTAEEEAVIQEVMKGKMTPTQAHIMTGRTIGAVYKKLYKERKALQDHDKAN